MSMASFAVFCDELIHSTTATKRLEGCSASQKTRFVRFTFLPKSLTGLSGEAGPGNSGPQAQPVSSQFEFIVHLEVMTPKVHHSMSPFPLLCTFSDLDDTASPFL